MYNFAKVDQFIFTNYLRLIISLSLKLCFRFDAKFIVRVMLLCDSLNIHDYIILRLMRLTNVNDLEIWATLLLHSFIVFMIWFKPIEKKKADVFQ